MPQRTLASILFALIFLLSLLLAAYLYLWLPATQLTTLEGIVGRHGMPEAAPAIRDALVSASQRWTQPLVGSILIALAITGLAGCFICSRPPRETT